MTTLADLFSGAGTAPATERTAALHFQRREGGRTWTVIHDPRLPIVEFLAQETATVYHRDRNQAWFNSKTDGDAIKEIIDAIEALPCLPIENAHYATESLEGIPGVAVSRQPFNTKDRDNPSKTVAVAVSESALAAALTVVQEAIRIEPAQATQLVTAMNDGTLKAGLIYDITGFQPSELRRQLDERSIGKPLAKEIVEGITPVTKWTLEKLIKTTIDGTLEPRNCSLYENLRQPIDVETARTHLEGLTEGHAKKVYAYSRTLATPAQRHDIAELMNSHNDQAGSVTLTDDDIAKLEKREAYRIIAKLSDRMEETPSDDFLSDERVDDYFTRQAGKNSKGSTPAAPTFISTKRNASSETRAANDTENSRRYVEAYLTQVRKEGGLGDRQDSATVVNELPNDNAVAMRVIVATRHHVAGFLDDTKSTVAIVERGHFYWPDKTEQEIATLGRALVTLPRADDPAPLEGELLIFERSARRPQQSADPTAKAKPRKREAYGYDSLDNEARVEEQPHGSAPLIDADERSGAAPPTSPAKTDGARRSAGYSTDDPVYFPQLGERTQTLAEANAVARARCDARKVAPNAPIEFAGPGAYEGLAIGRHSTSVTLLDERPEGARVFAVGLWRLESQQPTLYQRVQIPAIETSAKTKAPLTQAAVNSRGR